MWRSVFVFFVFRLLPLTSVQAEIELELSTNGPVYYKAPLAVFARLKNAPNHEYNWYFTANLPNGRFERTLFRRDRAMINATFHIEEKQVGEFKMAVTVSYTPFLIPETIAYDEIKFVITDKIPVKVLFKQNGTLLQPRNGQLEVSSADIVNASVGINDPSCYFQRNGTQMTIQWRLNHEIPLMNSSFSKTYPSAPDRSQDTLQMFLTASDANNTYIADGSFSTIIKAINPVLDVNATGKLWLQRGNLTHLEFSCNASPPIYYCFKFASSNTNILDFNCTESQYILRDSCKFSITHYFGAKGDYKIMIAVRNLVNDFLHWEELKRNYTVHVYDVASKGMLRLFIVPVSCIILGTIVAVSGYVLYDRTKGNMRVEVADFDFAGNSNREDLDATLVERTFWSHLRDELAESGPIFRWLTRVPPQSDPPLIEESHEDKSVVSEES